jgi:hypothetical protein
MRKFRIPVEIRATAVGVDTALEKEAGQARAPDAALDNPPGGSYKSTAISPLPRR